MQKHGLPHNHRLLTIIGLGNELLSDDGVGIRVLRELRKRLTSIDVVFEELSVGGLPLLDHIIDSEWCIIIDSIITGSHPPGTAFRFVQPVDHEPTTLTSSHQIDLAHVLSLATLLRPDLSRTVTVYAIEASDVQTFGDGCTEEVCRAIPSLVDVICRDVESDSQFMPADAGRWQVVHDTVQDCSRMEHI